MAIEAWEAPAFSLSTENMAIWNAAMSHAGRKMQIPDCGIGLSFAPLKSLPESGMMSAVLLEERPVGYLRIDDFPFRSHCDVDLEVADLAGLPPELADAVNAGMLSVFLSALPDELGSRLRVGAATEMAALRSEKLANSLQWFRCELHEVADEPIVFTLGARPDTVCAELTCNTPLARRVHYALGDQVTARVERLLGTAMLSLAECCGLEPGDCLLFRAAVNDSGRAVSVNRDVHFFLPDGDGWTCVEVSPLTRIFESGKEPLFSMEDDTLDLAEDGNVTEQLTLSPAPLAVEVSFHLGASRVPLSEIASWQVGAVVSLPTELNPDDTQVTVRINGTAFAQGDLVRIDDRLAVRLNRIRPIEYPTAG